MLQVDWREDGIKNEGMNSEQQWSGEDARTSPRTHKVTLI